jgi:hypothetical protein
VAAAEDRDRELRRELDAASCTGRLSRRMPPSLKPASEIILCLVHTESL